MEFAEGGDLVGTAERAGRRGAGVAVAPGRGRGRRLVRPAGGGPRAIHDSKVLHRDLKPRDCSSSVEEEEEGPSGVTPRSATLGSRGSCRRAPRWRRPARARRATCRRRSCRARRPHGTSRTSGSRRDRLPRDDESASPSTPTTRRSSRSRSRRARSRRSRPSTRRRAHLVDSLLQIDPMPTVVGDPACSRRIRSSSSPGQSRGLPLSRHAKLSPAAGSSPRARIPVPRKPSSPRPNEALTSPPLPQPPPVLTSPLTNSDAGLVASIVGDARRQGAQDRLARNAAAGGGPHRRPRRVRRRPRDGRPRPRSPLSSPARAPERRRAPFWCIRILAGPAPTRKSSKGGLPPKSPPPPLPPRRADARGAPGLESSRTSCSSPGATARSMCSSPGVTARSATTPRLAARPLASRLAAVDAGGHSPPMPVAGRRRAPRRLSRSRRRGRARARRRHRRRREALARGA